jgi:membrane associated rhomboid family serine protease
VSIALVIFGATLVASLAGLYAQPQLIERSLFRPYWFLRRRQYATVVTSGFVHADLSHLLFNMVTFWFFAFPLEKQVGPVRFAVLYLLGLVVSDLGTYFKHRHDPQYASLGASGAISAVLFAVGYVAYSWYSARHSRGRINHDAHLGGALFGLLFVLVTDPAAFAQLLRWLGA